MMEIGNHYDRCCVIAAFLLLVILIILRLTMVIDWSWVWVTAPLWATITILLTVLLCDKFEL